MSMCEDFPCCGHENNCCPDFDDGQQLNMKCTCGAVIPRDSNNSMCHACLRDYLNGDYDPYYDRDEDWDDDHGDC
jgi:hypothetical protein